MDESPLEKRWSAVCNAFEKGHTRTLVPLLPMVFQLNGRPYSLHDFFPMEPIFQTRLPRVLTLKTARQVSKSTCMAARSILISAIIPNFSTIFVTPLFEQVRRFSTQYVRPFIDNSLLRSVWKSANTESSELSMNGRTYWVEKRRTCSKSGVTKIVEKFGMIAEIRIDRAAMQVLLETCRAVLSVSTRGSRV
jgi:hypothetical protein